MKSARNPSTIHPPLAGYSHQIEISGPERMLVVAGQVGIGPDGSVPDARSSSWAIALDNVERNLEAAGMDIGDLVRLTTYAVGEWDLAARRQLMAERLGEHRPCMTLLFISALATPALLRSTRCLGEPRDLSDLPGPDHEFDLARAVRRSAPRARPAGGRGARPSRTRPCRAEEVRRRARARRPRRRPRPPSARGRARAPSRGAAPEAAAAHDVVLPGRRAAGQRPRPARRAGPRNARIRASISARGGEGQSGRARLDALVRGRADVDPAPAGSSIARTAAATRLALHPVERLRERRDAKRPEVARQSLRRHVHPANVGQPRGSARRRPPRASPGPGRPRPRRRRAAPAAASASPGHSRHRSACRCRPGPAHRARRSPAPAGTAAGRARNTGRCRRRACDPRGSSREPSAQVGHPSAASDCRCPMRSASRVCGVALRQGADVVDHVRLVVEAEIAGGARPALAATGASSACMRPMRARRFGLWPVAATRAAAQMPEAVAGLAGERRGRRRLERHGDERIGRRRVAHELEERSRAHDVGEWHPQVRGLAGGHAVERREGTGPEADARAPRRPASEVGHERGAQRAHDVAADDVHAAVGHDPQRVRPVAAQAPEGLTQGDSSGPGACSS